jgi:amino acid adenylation domain-containing protein
LFDVPFGKDVYSITQTPQVWLDHQIIERDGALHLNWDVVDELFPAGMIEDMFSAYCALLKQLTEMDWTEVSHEATLPVHHKNQQDLANATDGAVPKEMLHTLFHKQVNLDEHAPAVISSQITLTYGELFKLSNQLGHTLLHKDVMPNTLVGVLLEKGWEQVAAVMGILNSGAAYLPIDPNLPINRLRYLMVNGGINVLITNKAQLEKTELQQLLAEQKIETVCIDDSSILQESCEAIVPRQTLTDLAYVIYTSGSTGQPKGVAIDHQGAVNTVLDINQRFHVTSKDRVLAVSALNFDLSVYDIFGVLAAGGAVVFPDAQSSKDPVHWIELIQQHHISVWNSVPALMQILVDCCEDHNVALSEMRAVMMSGDWIPVSLPKRIQALNADIEIFSLGGATEASIWSIFYPVHDVDADWKSIPYGKPLTNQTFYVLDEHLNPCPFWVPGQLYIGGIGLAKEYWRDSAKTNAAFITHPQSGKRLYRTGDLGRYLPDGNIEFLGREDSQVKIRGHRIELGEIEAVLSNHPSVKDAIVTVFGDTKESMQLVGYYTLNQEAPETSSQEMMRQQNVIQDPVKRMDFKLQQRGIRTVSKTQERISLSKPEANEHNIELYLKRQTHRSYSTEPISIQTIGQFLDLLSPVQLNGSPLPKYRYPSAGNTYSIQTYLYVKENRVDDLEQGLYYYHPLNHELVEISKGEIVDATHYARFDALNAKTFDQAAFGIFFVADLSAIQPLYGELAKEFCLLETGAISQLLMEHASTYNLGLSPIGALDTDPVRDAFQLHPDAMILHSFVGGYIQSHQTKTWDLISAISSMGQQKIQPYLENYLPSYMVPSTLIKLEKLPLSANGKVDRKQLPAPNTKKDVASTDFVGPSSETEKSLVVLASKLMNLDSVGVTDNLFELGADSITATRFVSHIREQFQVQLSLTQVFQNPEISNLAQMIDAQINGVISAVHSVSLHEELTCKHEMIQGEI